MFSIQDIKDKQILFIQTKNLGEDKLKLANDNLVWSIADNKINKISLHRLLCLFIIGDTSFTTKILNKLQKFGVGIYFLSRNLSVYASFNPLAEGNYLVRQRQYIVDEGFALIIAKHLIFQKTNNQLQLLRSRNFLAENYNQITVLKKTIMDIHDSKSLLGVEGSIAKAYFKLYFNSSSKMDWYRREPRTKCDIPNLLLDIGYTYLFNFIDSILRLFGFDTYKGVYHKLFFQRKSLACDVMEVFRPLIDRALLKAYNLKQINPKDFKYKHQYYLEWKKSSHYSEIFLKEILKYKIPIFQYIQDYYRHFMRPDKYPFPIFKITKT